MSRLNLLIGLFFRSFIMRRRFVADVEHCGLRLRSLPEFVHFVQTFSLRLVLLALDPAFGLIPLLLLARLLFLALGKT